MTDEEIERCIASRIKRFKVCALPHLEDPHRMVVTPLDLVDFDKTRGYYLSCSCGFTGPLQGTQRDAIEIVARGLGI